jgi:hypothetical protein
MLWSGRRSQRPSTHISRRRATYADKTRPNEINRAERGRRRRESRLCPGPGIRLAAGLFQGEGRRRGRVHLRPADRDELRRDYEYAVDRNSGEFKAPFNQIANDHKVFTYEDKAIPTPNSDTPYSIVWMDLRAEPLVLSVPAVDPKRDYSVQLCDGNTYNYGYIGSRATGSEAGRYMVVGPDWKGETPPGVKKVFRPSTRFSAAIYRTQLFDPADMANVIKVQEGYKVEPLSAYLKQPAPPTSPNVDFVKFDKDLAKLDFFESISPSNSRPPSPTRPTSAPSSRASASGRGRPSTSRTSRWRTSWKSLSA